MSGTIHIACQNMFEIGHPTLLSLHDHSQKGAYLCYTWDSQWLTNMVFFKGGQSIEIPGEENIIVEQRKNGSENRVHMLEILEQ